MDQKLIALIAVLAVTATVTMNSVEKTSLEFESFKVKYAKSYASPTEEAYRFTVFMQNSQEVEQHNADKTQTYTQVINQFSDLTKAEFKSIYLGTKVPKQIKSGEVYTDTNFVGDVNWVTKGDVQRVKNQGQCGSCWAFSTCASCESAKAIFKGVLGDFSEQQLVDCAGSYGTQGCNGGWMYDAMDYFASAGICTESSYPYTAQDGTCQASSCTKDSFTISGHIMVTADSTSALKSACDKQPVSITVDAQNWSSYGGGVFSNCGDSLDHGVLLAGYTSSYWLVKNSWGASWGESGYIRLAMGNTCGLEDVAVLPKL